MAESILDTAPATPSSAHSSPLFPRSASSSASSVTSDSKEDRYARRSTVEEAIIAHELALVKQREQDEPLLRSVFPRTLIAADRAPSVSPLPSSALPPPRPISPIAARPTIDSSSTPFGTTRFGKCTSRPRSVPSLVTP